MRVPRIAFETVGVRECVERCSAWRKFFPPKPLRDLDGGLWMDQFICLGVIGVALLALGLMWRVLDFADRRHRDD